MNILRDNFLWVAGTTGVITQILNSTFAGAISTSSAALVSTGDSINITPGGGAVLALYTASFLNSGLGSRNTFGFSVDAAAPGQTAGAFDQPVASYAVPLTMIVNLGVLTSVAHNIAVFWAATAGTLNQGPQTRNLTLIELRR